ncbi:MAG: sel1 repeat family protein [Burkholderiales bacterium]|nr:sel1 repeat family protein [Burkholderiales bacterium]
MKDATVQSNLFVRFIGIILFACPAFGLCDEDYDRCVVDFGENGNLSVSILEQKAEEGLVEAQYCLAVVYHEGKSVSRDRAQAAVWYLRSGQKGHLEAQYWLCILYREGIGVEANALESLYWCQRAAKKNHANALYALGQWYYGGYGRNKFTDYLNAYIWFSRAVMAGDEAGEDMIRLLERQMTDLQILEAKKLLERDLP